MPKYTTAVGLVILIKLFHVAAFAASESIVFQVQPGATSLVSMSASTGGSDSATITYSGDFSADLTFDETTLIPQTITFSGGNITVSNTSLSIGTNVFFSGGGTFFTTIALSTNNLGQSLSTPTPSGQIHPQTGAVTNSDHRITIDRGILQTTISIPSFNVSESETINFASNPETSVPSGMTTIHLEELNSSLLVRNLRATVNSSINTSDADAIPDTNLTLNYSEQGSYVAIADFSIPTAYGRWVQDNALNGAQPEEKNPFGIPYALLFAFSLPADASTLPFTAIASASGPKVKIALPSGGLRADVMPTYAEMLLDPFTPLPAAYFDDGADSLNQGKTGPVTLSFPVGRTSFIRLAVHME